MTSDNHESSLSGFQNLKWFSKCTNSLEGEIARKSWRRNFSKMDCIKKLFTYRIQCNKRQADKGNKQHAHIYKLQNMIYKDETTKCFLFSVESKRLHGTQFYSLTFWKETLRRHMQSNILIGIWNFSFTTPCSQYLRRVSNCHLPTLILNDNLHKDIHREKTLMQ